jgi:pilus assembly protein CpaB
MNLKLPKGMVPIVVAGVVGLVATFTIYKYVSVKTRVEVKPTSKVVVVKKDLKDKVQPGTALNDQSMEMAEYPNELIPADAARSLDQVRGRVAMVQLAPGEPIMFGRLAPKESASVLASRLKPENRACSVRVDDVSGVAGFILPGDEVDVLTDMPIPNSSEHFSKMILQKIRVLTIGQMWDTTGDKKPVLVTTVTMEVSPDQAETLNLASYQGKIRLALRGAGSGDRPPVVTKGVSTTGLINGSSKNPSAAVASQRSIEVIKGMERRSSNM